jgi:hypothetical protein
MRATPIKKTPLISSIKQNYARDFKQIPGRILQTQKPIDSYENINTYKFTHENKTIQVLIDKVKSIITDTFIYNESGKRIEDAHYEYNNKNQLTSVTKKSISQSGKKNNVKTDIKYKPKHISVFKNINFGLITIKTIFGQTEGKRKIDLTINKPLENKIEEISYIEDQKLQAKISQNNEIRYEGFGDPLNGELVFSRSTLNTLADMECCELLSDGYYEKQIYFDNFKTVVKRDVTPTNVDFFAKNGKDMITPHQELVATIKPLLD